jgi:hypothetical protein
MTKELDKKLGTIHLQGIGRVPAITAELLKAGDVIVYNYGHTAKVLSTRPVSARYIEAYVESQISTGGSGKVYVVKLKKDRLVAVGRK